MTKNHLLWMLVGCGLLILVLVVLGNQLSNGWLIALVIGACVIPHLFMMRGHKGNKQNATPTPDDKPTNHKGGCCH